jgi:hypothetical protein
MAGWSEEAVSSELRERLDRWSEGLRARDARLEWPTDRWSEGWLAGWQLLEAERSEKSRGERNEDLELGSVRLKKKIPPKSVPAEIFISPDIFQNALKRPK